MALIKAFGGIGAGISFYLLMMLIPSKLLLGRNMTYPRTHVDRKAVCGGWLPEQFIYGVLQLVVPVSFGLPFTLIFEAPETVAANLSTVLVLDA